MSTTIGKHNVRMKKQEQHLMNTRLPSLDTPVEVMQPYPSEAHYTTIPGLCTLLLFNHQNGVVVIEPLQI